MLNSNSTPIRENGSTRPAGTVAERHGYGPNAPQRPARANVAGKLRPWLIGAGLGLLVGGAAVGYAAYQTMPVQATEVQRIFADVDGDGAADLILSGWVIFAPKAAGQ
jgi:hypothetical protein